jgi:tetratricopeptide (TPR) repeat protein
VNLVAIPEHVLMAVFAVVFLLVIVLVYLQREYDRLLRERHPEVSDALAQEDADKGEDDGDTSPAALRFLWRRGYRKLGDDELTRAGDRMRALLVPTLAGFGFVFVGSGYNSFCEETAAERPPNAAEVMQDKRTQALALHNQGKIEQAIRLYDELLGPAGADAELVYWRGVAHGKAGREDMALVDFRRVMDLDPGRFEAYLYADRILSRQRRFDDCVDVWNRYLRVVPGDATAYMERGGSHYHRGDFAAAHADARRACELGKREACAMAERVKARM